jgi:membrane protease YdiL (CAAX protease family)
MHAQSSDSLGAPVVSPPSPSGKGILVRHPLVTYFVFAYALSWLAVVPYLLSKSVYGFFPFALPQPVFLIGAPLVGPTLVAFVLTARLDGRAGVRQLLRRYVLWRVGVQWYLFIVLGPFAVLTLGACVFFGVEPLVALAHKWPQVLAQYLPLIVFGALLGGPLGEEPGWRGFALPRMQKRLGPVPASLLLGALWGGWHLVGFLGGWLGAFTVPAFVGVILSGMAFSVIVTWVFNHTRGSILIAILLHGASNAAVAVGGAALLPARMPPLVHTIVYSSGIGVLSYGALAVLLVAVTRGTLAYGTYRPLDQ